MLVYICEIEWIREIGRDWERLGEIEREIERDWKNRMKNIQETN
jgi:hypothetical protein